MNYERVLRIGFYCLALAALLGSAAEADAQQPAPDRPQLAAPGKPRTVATSDLRIAPEVPKGIRILPEAPGKDRQAFGEGKTQFLALLDDSNLKRFGFDLKPQDKEIGVLEGLPESVISVEELRAFNPLVRVDTKHWEVDRIMYPLVTGRRVRAAITTALVDGRWKPVAYGQVPLIRAVMAAKFKALSAAELTKQPVQYRLVTIFGLNEQFLGAFPANATGSFWLIPIRTRKGFEAGVPQDGKSVLLKLQEAAKALTGNGPT